MLRRRLIVNLAIFAGIALLMGFWAIQNLVTVDFIERPYRVTADFENAMGVLPSAEVTYLGTQVGRVDDVERIEGGVRITMRINREEKIPAGVRANIWRKSALGEQYVDFSNPEDPETNGPVLEDGDHIGRERTEIPIEFADMLRAADSLIQSIEPEDLSVITRELAQGLKNRTDDLRTLIIEGDRLAETFASRSETLDRLATNNTRLTAVLADHSESLVSTLEDLRAVAETLADVHTEFEPLVEQGADLFADLVPLVRDHRGTLSCVFDTVDQVIDVTTTDARLQGLETLILDFPVASRQLLEATDIEEGPDGSLHRWARVDLTDTTDNEAEDFVPNRDTPPPEPAIPACDIEFASTSEPGTGETDPPSGTTPATGANLALSGGLGVLVILLVIRTARPQPLE